MLAAWRLSQRAVTFIPRVRSQTLNPLPMAAAAAAASPKRLRVYSSVSGDGRSANGAGSGKRVGTHNGSFHCDEALGCYLIRLTSQFAGADVVRTRDPQVSCLLTGSINLPLPYIFFVFFSVFFGWVVVVGGGVVKWLWFCEVCLSLGVALRVCTRQFLQFVDMLCFN